MKNRCLNHIFGYCSSVPRTTTNIVKVKVKDIAGHVTLEDQAITTCTEHYHTCTCYHTHTQAYPLQTL